jgi:hypothetical protein
MPMVKIPNSKIRIHANGHSGTTIGLNDFGRLWGDHHAGDPLTAIVEKFALNYVSSGLPQNETFLFVRFCCAWGGLRGRNFKLLYEANATDQFQRLRDKLESARDFSMKNKFRDAILELSQIKGTRTSFRSKFLKFLAPDHAAVLDSVLRAALGYPDDENPSNYETFVKDCIEIRNELNNTGLTRSDGQPWRTSDVEMAIFKHVNP